MRQRRYVRNGELRRIQDIILDSSRFGYFVHRFQRMVGFKEYKRQFGIHRSDHLRQDLDHSVFRSWRHWSRGQRFSDCSGAKRRYQMQRFGQLNFDSIRRISNNFLVVFKCRFMFRIAAWLDRYFKFRNINRLACFWSDIHSHMQWERLVASRQLFCSYFRADG